MRRQRHSGLPARDHTVRCSLREREEVLEPRPMNRDAHINPLTGDNPVDNAVLRRLVDESDLRKLILALARCLDERDWEGYGNLFTEDGVYKLPEHERRGPKAIAEGPSTDLAIHYEAMYHFLGNTYIDIDRDEAQIVAYNVAIHLPRVNEPEIHADVGGRYEARARRTSNGWRFTECAVIRGWTNDVPVAFLTQR